MVSALNIALAQINPTVGDLKGNCDKIIFYWKKSQNADLIVFPELCLCGYPAEDLILKSTFLDECEKHVNNLVEASKNLNAAAVIGTPWRIKDQTFNAAVVIFKGKIIHTALKNELPNYGVFDEKRVFNSGPLSEPFVFKDTKIGLMICEDMWSPQAAAYLKSKNAEFLVVINASPFDQNKHNLRLTHAKDRVRETSLTLVYINQVGGQDELVFDGCSFVLNQNAELVLSLKDFEEDFVVFTHSNSNNPMTPKENGAQSIYKALCLGLKDYVHKNNFSGVLLGLSGGIDSALSAAIACDSIGAQNVHCVMMPSEFTSQDSLDDAQALAAAAGCSYQILSIHSAIETFHELLPNLSGLAHENTQSRIRGLILMALSNMSGKLLLSTGNKSEMATGYATLYGDMNGGFNPLKDVYKTQVYELAKYRNSITPLIPERVITKAPTAELKPNQTDQDTLPPYDVLDSILKGLIEEDLGLKELIDKGHDRALVCDIWRMLDRAEYKRRQSPPGVKITSRGFGRERRYPMTNHFINIIEKSSVKD